MAADPVSIGCRLSESLAALAAEEKLVGLLSLPRRGRYERSGFELYGAAVAAARQPFLYTGLGVPDTLDGRFDMVALHAFLLIQRLKREPAPGPVLAQAVFDAMFSDMDVNLREMGVGDLSIGRKVRVMWEAFHGRSAAYASAMTAGDMDALEAALQRNVWRGAPSPDGSVLALRRVVLAQEAHLATQALTVLARGAVEFLPPEAASR
jgi:cytochrome b pre-mRNA-processing protein 3